MCIRDRFYAVIEGQIEVSKAIIKEKFDLIIFTGGTEKGRLVAKAAAENLTPCILELGGKSPCIVDEDVDLEGAAPRVALGRFANAGQTCIAVDYVLVHESIKKKLIEAMMKWIPKSFGEDPQQSKDYQRIINAFHVERVKNLLSDNHGGKIVCGGKVDGNDRYIEPTIVDGPRPDSAMMREEIFGPVLPVLTYRSIEEAIEFVNQRDKPLALYYFGSKNYQRILNETSSGSISRNDAIGFVINNDLPFGGVGASGLSKLHGKFGFDNCSHLKACFERSKMPTGGAARWMFPPFEDSMVNFLKKTEPILDFLEALKRVNFLWVLLTVLTILGAQAGYLDDYMDLSLIHI
eukprot:TRINITY_DN1991_c0_g3_i2.p1 TRINITY_DN1991_c0_g3~~TRINITY_DN1991_c0_g3_i2.p1  ORF type:complete len:349 (+),score=74.64 TRINITY_DN1991_c0_g3_i2:70-1116(+)